MFIKVSLAAAFFVMAGASLAGASESARPIAIPALHTSTLLDRWSPGIVVAQDDSNDSADSDSDSSDSNDSSDSADNNNDSGDSDSGQNAGNDQADQQPAQPQGFQAPDPGAGDAGQGPLNSYPQQVNPNQ